MLYLKLGEDEKIMQAPTRLRDRLILRLFLETGVRCAELCNIRIGDIDFSRREILIRQGKGGKTRLVFIDFDALQLIKKYIGSRRTGPLFLSRTRKTQKKKHGGLTTRQVQRIVKDAAIAADVRNAELISPHCLRHTMAIHWVQRGGDIESLRRLLGHSNLKVTQVYLNFDLEHVRAEFDRLHDVPGQPSSPSRARAAYIS